MLVLIIVYWLRNCMISPYSKLHLVLFIWFHFPWNGQTPLPLFRMMLLSFYRLRSMLHPIFRVTFNVLSPHTQYEQPDGTYETILKNLGICCFVWEHFLNVNHVLHCLKHAGVMVSAKKLCICQSKVVIVGQTCNYNECISDKSKASKIRNWPSPCQSQMEVHGFLGTTGTVCIWIKDYAKITHPLINLTHDSVSFTWTQDE